MCGLTGFIDYKFSGDLSVLNKMNSTLQHRGPDSEDSVIFDDKQARIGLAHRRLSIIDLSACGNQPMSDESKNFSIVFNGEIYNYIEIKRELQSLGVTFFSTSDTEVILKSYIEWGIKAVNKFIGMFAFVIYDRMNNKVIFCRDRVGVKPFYYFLSNDLILFGSELKALMAHPSFDKKIDLGALGSFFKHGWIGAPSTIFESTYKAKPGHILEIDLQSRQITEHCYWDAHQFYNLAPVNLSFQEAKESLHDLLKSACEYRMVADTEVGIFLSGGFDSSLVTAIVQANRSKQINTFSIGFEDKELNEAPFAKAVANHLGTNHHELICTSKNAFDLISSLPYHYDEPFADSSAIPTMLVSRLAAGKVKVALSADGGDEIFGGYPKYYIKMSSLDTIQRIPSFLKKPFARLLSIPVNYFNTENPHHKILLEKLQLTLNADNPREIFRFRSEPYHFSNYEIKKLLKQHEQILLSKTFYDNYNLNDMLNPSLFMMALEYKTILPDDMLVKVDRASMAYSLEAREPFLDHRLLEFSARLNSDHHFYKNKPKALLREISYEYIPQKLLDRPKKGFSIPTDKWLRTELRESVMEFSSKAFIDNQNIFSFKNCTNMIANYYNGKDKNPERIWFFLMFQLWYKRWMTS